MILLPGKRIWKSSFVLLPGTLPGLTGQLLLPGKVTWKGRFLVLPGMLPGLTDEMLNAATKRFIVSQFVSQFYDYEYTYTVTRLDHRV